MLFMNHKLLIYLKNSTTWDSLSFHRNYLFTIPNKLKNQGLAKSLLLPLLVILIPVYLMN